MWDNESEYLEHLKEERRLFAWTLQHYGGFSEADSKKKSEEFYYYESVNDEQRGLVFHDEAWHWAMLEIHGDQYWVKHPELIDPPSGYK